MVARAGEHSGRAEYARVNVVPWRVSSRRTLGMVRTSAAVASSSRTRTTFAPAGGALLRADDCGAGADRFSPSAQARTLPLSIADPAGIAGVSVLVRTAALRAHADNRIGHVPPCCSDPPAVARRPAPSRPPAAMFQSAVPPSRCGSLFRVVREWSPGIPRCFARPETAHAD